MNTTYKVYYVRDISILKICYTLGGDSMKYVKVMYGAKSGADREFQYKIGEVNIANNWNKNAKTGREFGGFNYTTEDCILRWLHRGDTIYDVLVPEDAENIKIDGATTIYRTNKIILSNPSKIDDNKALYYYKISNIPEKSYYKALAVVSLMNYKNTAYEIIRDKVNKDNIEEVLSEWNDFIWHDNKNDRKSKNELINEVESYLNEIKSDVLISRFVDKDIYRKVLTSDRVINITGESGSGKSTYVKNNFNSDEYLIIDTDVVFGDRETSNDIEKYLQDLVHNRFTNYREILCSDFDACYKFILDNITCTDKTIVIDSAQYRNLKDVSLLKGEIIVIRTSIEKCYERCINRYLDMNSNVTSEEIIKYKEKKKGMYIWYLSLNTFLDKIDKQ